MGVALEAARLLQKRGFDCRVALGVLDGRKQTSFIGWPGGGHGKKRKGKLSHVGIKGCSY